MVTIHARSDAFFSIASSVLVKPRSLISVDLSTSTSADRDVDDAGTPPAAASGTATAQQQQSPHHNALSGPILAAVILAGFALVVITGLVVWLHHRRGARGAALWGVGRGRTAQHSRWRRSYVRPEEEEYWDDGSGARTLQRFSLAVRRASVVFKGGKQRERVNDAGGATKSKHIRVGIKDLP